MRFGTYAATLFLLSSSLVAGCSNGGVNTTPVASATATPTPGPGGAPKATPTPTARPSGSASATPTPAAASPTPTPAVTPLYLYVATSQHIDLFAATATTVASTPTVSVPSTSTSGVAVNANFVATCTGSAINVYTKPLTASSVPAFTYSPVRSNQEGGSTFNYTVCSGDVAFDASGNLYATVTGAGYGTHGVVLKFATPLTAGSAPTIVADLTIANNIVRGLLALDPSGNLYLNSQLGLEQWTPPNYVQPESVVFPLGNTGIGAAFDANGNAYFANQSVVSFVPAPLTGTSAASYSIPLTSVAFGVALSPQGSLAVYDSSGLLVFGPPLSAASTASGQNIAPGETINQITYGN
jgi:hypothetical protein